MLSKKIRVGKELFPQVLLKARCLYGNNMSLRVLNTNITNKTKFSFVVSRKVSNKAVRRNLLKRRGYSIIKNISKYINNGFICVFFFKKTSTLLSYKELEKEIFFLLKKAKVLK